MSNIQTEINRLTQAKTDIKGVLDRLSVSYESDKLDSLALAIGSIKKVEAKQENGVITIPAGYISEEQTFVVSSDLTTGYLINGADGNVYFQAVKEVDGEIVADGDPVKVEGIEIPDTGVDAPSPVYPLPEADIVTGYIINNEDGSVYFQRVKEVDGEITNDGDPVLISEANIPETGVDEPAYVCDSPATSGCELYKCAEVFGPSKVSGIVVSGAGSVEVNGNYLPTELRTEEGTQVYKHETAEYYYFELWGEKGICTSPTQRPSEGLYYNMYDDGWYSNSGTEPAPTVTAGNIIVNADVPKTWNGYKAVLTDGVYSFEDTVTAGLSYGAGYTPTVKKIYNSDATLAVSKVWQGGGFDISDALFAIDASKGVNDLVDGVSPTIYGDGQEVLRDGEFCFDYARAFDYTIGASMSALQDFTIEMDYTITSGETGYCGFFGNRAGWTTMCVCMQWGRSGYRPAMFWNDYFDTSTGGAEHQDWINDGKYHHVAMVRSGDVIKLYSDGIAIAQYSGASMILNLAIENMLSVGVQHVENQIFPGRMKHFRVVPNAVYTADFSDDIPAWVGA